MRYDVEAALPYVMATADDGRQALLGRNYNTLATRGEIAPGEDPATWRLRWSWFSSCPIGKLVLPNPTDDRKLRARLERVLEDFKAGRDVRDAFPWSRASMRALSMTR